MALNITNLRNTLLENADTHTAKEQFWIREFGSKKAYQESIMSPKPKIPNDWTAANYFSYHKTYGITKLRALDDWANPDDAYTHYRNRLASHVSAAASDTPSEDQFCLINYVEFCNDVNRFTNEMKDAMCEYGVPELQAYVGAYTSMHFILKRFRKQFYSTLYTFQEDTANTVYQQTPLRHLLVFLIDRRLNRLIPNSDTFKFGKEYFQTFEFRKEASDMVYDYLIENYTSDMVACKFLF